MLSLLRNLAGGKVLVGTRPVGVIGDIFFDNRDWTIRYLLLRIGSWFRQKSILITPVQIESIEWVKQGASISVKPAVMDYNPQINHDHFALYHWPYFWTGAGILGIASTSSSSQGSISPESKFKLISKNSPFEKRKLIHIQSFNGTLDYRIEARGAPIGYLEDLVVSQEDWTIRYLVVEMQLLLTERLTLISPEWIQSIRWDQLVIQFQLLDEMIHSAPQFQLKQILSRDFEETIWNHFHKPCYWKRDLKNVHPIRKTSLG